MKPNPAHIDLTNINLEKVGRRIGLVVSKYKDTAAACEAAGISPDTLRRYLDGTQRRISAVALARLCRPNRFSIMWLFYGQEFPKHI